MILLMDMSQQKAASLSLPLSPSGSQPARLKHAHQLDDVKHGDGGSHPGLR